jgi:hypothetical protein
MALQPPRRRTRAVAVGLETRHNGLERNAAVVKVQFSTLDAPLPHLLDWDASSLVHVDNLNLFTCNPRILAQR